MMRSQRTSLSLRNAAVFCLIAGAVLLSLCTCAWASSHLYQAYEGWQFDKSVLLSKAFQSRSESTEGSKAERSNTPGTLGRLEIPRLGLSVVVVEGVDDQDLRLAVGHVPNTAVPGQQGNVAVAGHRDTFFRPLQNIRKNDEITMETAAGTFEYSVQGLWIVAPDQIEVLDSTAAPSLTLITCYPFHYIGAAPYRFIVRAQQIEPSVRTKSTLKAAKATKF